MEGAILFGLHGKIHNSRNTETTTKKNEREV